LAAGPANLDGDKRQNLDALKMLAIERREKNEHGAGAWIRMMTWRKGARWLMQVLGWCKRSLPGSIINTEPMYFALNFHVVSIDRRAVNDRCFLSTTAMQLSRQSVVVVVANGPVWPFECRTVLAVFADVQSIARL